MLDPMLDTRNNIIVSTARYGKLYYSFYRISPKKKLINLGHDFEGEWNDSTDKYNKAIRLIKQHDRKVKY
jgi:hypothetical protein